MLGRAVFVLCLLSGAAFACPPPHDEYTRTEYTLTDDQVGLVVAFALMGFCAVGFVITRANAVRRTFVTSKHLVDVDLDLVKRVARIQRNRTAIFGIACSLALYGSTQLPLPAPALLFVTATPLFLLCFAWIAVCRLQMLIGLQPEPSLRTYSHGHFLYAARNNRLVDWVAAPPRLLARASTLPVARVR